MLNRAKIAVAMLAGALTVPVLFAQGPGPDAGQGGSDGGPGARRLPGPDGPGGWRRGEDGERGPGGWRRGGESRRMRGGRGGRGEFALARLAANPEMREKLGLTAEQTGKITQQTSEFRKASIRSRADLEVKRVELEDLLRAENPDRAAIDRKLDEIGAARLADTKARFHYRMAMRDVLTPEQRTKLRQMREQRGRDEFRGRRDGAERGPRGPRPPAKNED